VCVVFRSMPTSTEDLAALSRGYVRTIEIADFLGISRQRADQLSVVEGFPRPRMVAGRPMWKRTSIEAWAKREWWGAKPWRRRPSRGEASP